MYDVAYLLLALAMVLGGFLLGRLTLQKRLEALGTGVQVIVDTHGHRTIKVDSEGPWVVEAEGEK